VPGRNGLVYIEHTLDRPGKFVGLATVGGKQEHVSRGLFSIGESKMSSRNIMAARTAIAGGAVIFFALRGSRYGKQFRARVRNDGMIVCGGTLYRSPTLAAIAAVKSSRNGWTSWHYERAPGDRARLKELRR
jgi:hypothetical protein